MSWNYRILAHEYRGETTLQVHEVHYLDDEPRSYSPSPAAIMGDTIQELRKVATLILLDLAKEKPILYAGDKFPQTYKP